MPLTGNKIKFSYESLIQLEGDTGLTTSFKRVMDGDGGFSPLSLNKTSLKIANVGVGSVSDKIVVVDSNDVVKYITATDLVDEVGNGLSVVTNFFRTGNTIRLVTSTATYDIDIDDLDLTTELNDIDARVTVLEGSIGNDSYLNSATLSGDSLILGVLNKPSQTVNLSKYNYDTVINDHELRIIDLENAINTGGVGDNVTQFNLTGDTLTLETDAPATFNVDLSGYDQSGDVTTINGDITNLDTRIDVLEGAQGYKFQTVTDGSNDVVADSLTDTLTFTGTGGIVVTATPATDTITIDGSAISGGGGGETLAQTLVLGNTTGGTDMIVSDGDVITGSQASPAIINPTNGNLELGVDISGGTASIFSTTTNTSLIQVQENAIIFQTTDITNVTERITIAEFGTHLGIQSYLFSLQANGISNADAIASTTVGGNAVVFFEPVGEGGRVKVARDSETFHIENEQIYQDTQSIGYSANITWNYLNGYQAQTTATGDFNLSINDLSDGRTGLYKVTASGQPVEVQLPATSVSINGGGDTVTIPDGETWVLGVTRFGATYYWTIGENFA